MKNIHTPSTNIERVEPSNFSLFSLSPEPIRRNHPWKLDAHTKRIGREGIKNARNALLAAKKNSLPFEETPFYEFSLGDEIQTISLSPKFARDTAA